MNQTYRDRVVGEVECLLKTWVHLLSSFSIALRGNDFVSFTPWTSASQFNLIATRPFFLLPPSHLCALLIQSKQLHLL